MDYKKFIPNIKCFGGINWAKPEVGPKHVTSTVLTVLGAIMLVAVFLPWFHWEYVLTDGENVTLESVNKLGITTLWGIFGLLVTVVALFGALYKQYAYTFWASLVAILLGCLGANAVHGLEFAVGKTDYVIIKENLELMQIKDQTIEATHVGAKLFMIVATLLAAVSFVQIVKKDEEAKPGCIAKVALGVSAVITGIICLDAALVTPTVLSVLASKIIVWNLPLVAILIVAYAYVKGESKYFAGLAVALLAVAFCYTNTATIDAKCRTKVRHDVAVINQYYELANDESVIDADKSNKKLAEKAQKATEKAAEGKKQTQGINDHKITKSDDGANGSNGSNESAGYQEY